MNMAIFYAIESLGFFANKTDLRLATQEYCFQSSACFLYNAVADKLKKKRSCLLFTAQSLNWLDGSEVKYNNWAKGNENASGECSVLLSRNGTWSKSDCTRGQSRAVCKVPQGVYDFV